MTGAPVEVARHTLLICSVGGTAEPVAAAIRHWRPARIMFLCSDQTRASVTAALAAASSPIGPGCTDQIVLRDPQNLEWVLRDLRPLDAYVLSWQQRGDNYAAVVDFTGGTKVMSAALALVARRWKCDFAYVGGRERSKDGVGVVLSGREEQFTCFNPWDALGFQAVEDAVTVFNHGGYAAAAALLDGAVKNAGQPALKRELATLKAVVDAYAAWDCFDHDKAKRHFDDALKNRNDLAAIFPHETRSLVARLERHRDRAAQLASESEATAAWVEDLVQNAARRAAEGRFDDAVARLYRAFEALAQVRLREAHGIPDTKHVRVEQLPDTLRTEWANRGRDNRSFMLGLQDAWCVLKGCNDELGRRFFELGLADEQRSPLVARNQSILAHGFQPVGKDVYTQLDEHLRSLASFDHADSHDWRLPAPG